MIAGARSSLRSSEIISYEYFGIERMKNNRIRLAKSIALGICLCIAVGLRFYKPDALTGLEHDEALICNGARSIAIESSFFLTGDKVYEGPLLEYLLAGFFFIFSPSVLTARVVMAVAGCLSILFIYFAVQRCWGFLPALAVALSCAVSPWGFLSSRVIYACNLVPFFGTVMILSMVLMKNNHRRYLIAASVAIGFAMHGHLFACIWLVPVFILYFTTRKFSRKNDLIYILLSIIGLLFVYSPVLIYNLTHGFPALDVFFGSEGHAPTGQSFLYESVSRITGYVYTIVASLTGTYLWPDITFQQAGMLIVPILVFAGFLISAYGAMKKNTLDLCCISWLVSVMLVVPLVSKHKQDWTVWGFAHPSLPHYLDVLFPLLMLFIGRLTLWLASHWKKKLLFVAFFMVLLLEPFVFVTQTLIPLFSDPVAAGRWRPGIQDVTSYIQNTIPKTSPIFVPYMFESGYPQCTFLLPDYTILPFIETPTGWYDASGNLISGTITMLVKDGNLPPLFRDLTPLKTWGTSKAPIWALFQYPSPMLQFSGEATCDGVRYEIQLDVTESTKSTCALKRADGYTVTIENLTRFDKREPHPAFSNKKYVITSRHESLIDLLNHRYIGSMLNGSNGTILFSVENPPRIDITLSDKSILHCADLKGKFVAR